MSYSTGRPEGSAKRILLVGRGRLDLNCATARRLIKALIDARWTTRFTSSCYGLVSLAFLAGCGTTVPPQVQQARTAAAQSIRAEPPGDYYVGRRYYKEGYRFWGYVRRPGQPWASSQLVVLNENQKLAPDREQLNFGVDKNYEYKLYGSFSGDKIYEPRSDGFYPEFVLKRYEVTSKDPVPIFRSQSDPRAAAAVSRQLIERPD